MIEQRHNVLTRSQGRIAQEVYANSVLLSKGKGERGVRNDLWTFGFDNSGVMITFDWQFSWSGIS